MVLPPVHAAAVPHKRLSIIAQGPSLGASAPQPQAATASESALEGECASVTGLPPTAPHYNDGGVPLPGRGHLTFLLSVFSVQTYTNDGLSRKLPGSHEVL